jgi:hypothetical protein
VYRRVEGERHEVEITGGGRFGNIRLLEEFVEGWSKGPSERTVLLANLKKKKVLPADELVKSAVQSGLRE